MREGCSSQLLLPEVTESKHGEGSPGNIEAHRRGPRSPNLMGMPLFARRQSRLVDAAEALPGRDRPVLLDGTHEVLHVPLHPPFPDGSEQAIFALGCFWGAEKIFWQLGGVHVTAVGYAGGLTRNPTYEEVCSGRTGHAEAVLVVFLPDTISYEQLLRAFWEGHNPTEGMRQGNDAGTQYRSAIYWTSEAQRDAALASKQAYERMLSAVGYGEITTEIEPAGPVGGGEATPVEGSGAGAFYYAEDYHQQYLAKNPGGYCGLGGTGVSCPVGLPSGPAAH
jgi:peptide-methionine (S)-S-oxide reductase